MSHAYDESERLKASNKKGTGTSQKCLSAANGELRSEPVPFLLDAISFIDDPWDVFVVDDDVEPEPEYGDFWGELDDDYADGDQ